MVGSNVGLIDEWLIFGIVGKLGYWLHGCWHGWFTGWVE